MEFPGWQGYQRNSICVEFPGVSVFGLGIPKKGSNINLWNIQGLSFVVSGFSRGSQPKVNKMKNSSGGIQKSISSTPPSSDQDKENRGDNSEKLMQNFHGSCYLVFDLGQEFPRGVTQFCRFSEVNESFSLDFQKRIAIHPQLNPQSPSLSPFVFFLELEQPNFHQGEGWFT